MIWLKKDVNCCVDVGFIVFGHKAAAAFVIHLCL